MSYSRTTLSIVFLITVLSMSILNVTSRAEEGASLEEVRERAAGNTLKRTRGVTDRAYLELREWCESGDLEPARRAKARLQGFLNAYDRIKARNRDPRKFPRADPFFVHRYLWQDFLLLRKAGLVDEKMESRMRNMAEDLCRVNEFERSPNNRAFSFARGMYYAIKAFPDLPQAEEIENYIEAVWRDWYIPGDTYEPAYTGFHYLFLELSALLGKKELLSRDKLRRTYDRYLAEIGPSGHVVQSGDGGPYKHDRIGGPPGGISEPFFSEVMKHSPEPKYLWGLKRAFMRGPGRTEDDFHEAYPQYRNMEVKAPQWGSLITKRWPATFQTPDNMILVPRGREDPEAPYARFWIWDDANFLYHGGRGDRRGNLSHYEVGGVLLMREGGRGYEKTHWNNTFAVNDPDLDFRKEKGVHSGRWYRGSANLRYLRRYLHTPSESERYRPHPDLPTKVQDREQPYGFFHATPAGVSGKNDVMRLGEKEKQAVAAQRFDFKLDSEEHDEVVVMIKNFFIAGPAGEKILLPLDEIDNISFQFPNEDQEHNNVTVEPDPETGRNVICFTMRPGTTEVFFKAETEKFNVTDDYNRIGLHYKYVLPEQEDKSIPINGVKCDIGGRSTKLHQQGGILTDAHAEDKNNDSYGSVTYDSIWTYDSTWRRRVVLTKEGIMVVRDEFNAGDAADGMIGGPVWQLPPTDLHSADNWFAAPLAPVPPKYTRGPFRHGGGEDYGEDQFSMMVAFGRSDEHETGFQVQSQPQNLRRNAVYDQAKLTGGKTHIFLSVLIPHSPEYDPAKIASGLEAYTETGRSIVKLSRNDDKWPHPSLKVEFKPGNEWSVRRDE